MRQLTKVTLSSRLTLAVVLAVALLAAITAAAPTPAEAQQTRCGSEFTYYSDATYTCEVGLRGWLPYDCGCASYGYGYVTPYRTFDYSVC